MYDTSRRFELKAQKEWESCEVVRHEVLPAARPPECAFVHVTDSHRKALVLPHGDEFCVWGAEDAATIFHLLDGDVWNQMEARDDLPIAQFRWTVSHDGGNMLVTGDQLHGITSWRINSAEQLFRYQLLHQTISIVASHGRVVVADEGGKISLFELNQCTGALKLLETWPNTHQGIFTNLAARQDVLVVSTPKRIQVFDLQKRRCLGVLPVRDIDHNRTHYLDLNADVLLAARLNSLRVYAFKEHLPISRVIYLAEIKIRAVKLLSESKALVSVNGDGTILLVCLETGKILDRILTPLGEVYSIGVTCDARLIISSRKAPFGVAVLEPIHRTPLWLAIRKHAAKHFGKLFVARNPVARRLRQRRRRFTLLTVSSVLTLLLVTLKLVKTR